MAKNVRHNFGHYRLMIPFGYDEKNSATDNHDHFRSRAKLIPIAAVWAHIFDYFR